MSAMGFPRISGFAALGFAGLITLGNVIAVPAGLPAAGSDTDLDEISAFFAEQSAIVGASSALTPAAWVLATLFGAGVVSVLWRAELHRREAWSLVGFAGLILQNAAFSGLIAIRLALTSTADDGTAAVVTLWALYEALFALNGTFLALALIGLSVGGRRAGLSRPRHARLGLVSAALLFLSATLTSLFIGQESLFGLLGLAGWLLWVAWITAYGITLIRLGSSHAPTRR
ncbi:2-oxoglutarate/malate transporter [Streptomyces albipurpureus]|uniref:2-oxoglutarate/malate transporter n=1 Tax=Streptomyces albipurpureus TaxID=2897419 RepID=A0ABT0UH44_9ACTN|nr:2-oxoglutarate/malate transporter [Streptomyces sp. CWNU-1]MCM2387949.1 2-oxoglutarate/malate transporter [Streptomyces sp. CWNU-1]